MRLFFIIIMINALFSCKPYYSYTEKKYVLVEEKYQNDTLYLQDYVFCGSFFELKHLTLHKNHSIPYNKCEIMDLIISNLEKRVFMIKEKSNNYNSYSLCSNFMYDYSFDKMAEEFKYLFPQNDNKMRLVPYIIFNIKYGVGKTLSPVGYYDESGVVNQSIHIIFIIFKNGKVI
ncbi:MAG: hypothetical protein JJU02_12435 [Cryomorphaceae bacterium]|nr:hypothetical protein [Cryomorphaceae bacterium]